MAVTTNFTNKPINPRSNDQSPLAFNRAKLYSGKALDFDGVNDEIDLDGFTMSGNTASFAFYLKADEWNASDFIFDSRPTRLSIGGDSANANTLNIRSGTTWVKLADISDTTNTNHFVITIDGTTAKLFLNGQSFGYEVTLSSEIDLSSNANTALMSYSAGASSYFNGQLSGFKIFNTALTAAQVADLYNNPEKIVPTGVSNDALKLWLPMMEGAGTTAYDGSGNGNHGTINGATWTHGVGAPVAQTAVIDWNKGTNIILESENPDNLPSFAARGFTKNSSTETSPIGTNDAHKYTEDNTNTNPALVWSGDYSTGASQTLKVYLKADASTSLALSTQGQTSGGNINVTTEWQQFEVTQSVNSTSGPHIGGFATITQGSGIVLYMWHPQMSYGDSVYVPTLATAQTSDVLLPAGLTTGRDITGVNLFENVRKQGALNLDGNSWAEVHDNASLDFSSGMTLETWVQIDDADGINQHVLGKWNSGAGKKEYLIYYAHGANAVQFYFGHGTNVQSASFSITATGQWFHFVGTTDGSTITPYVNGVAGTTAAQTTALAASDIDVTIGTDDTKGISAVQKQLAQPRIYNRALTAAEVLQNYNSGKSIYTNS